MRDRERVERFRHDTGELQRLTEAVDSEADLAELRESAETAAETGRALASRQEEALDTLREDLLSSPEIVRWVSLLTGGRKARVWEAMLHAMNQQCLACLVSSEDHEVDRRRERLSGRMSAGSNMWAVELIVATVTGLGFCGVRPDPLFVPHSLFCHGRCGSVFSSWWNGLVLHAFRLGFKFS